MESPPLISSSSSFLAFDNLTSVLVASLSVLVVTVLLVWILDKFKERTVLPNPVLTRGIQIGHYWSVVTPITGHPAYCNVCAEGPLLSSGARCDACGIWTDEVCISAADKKIGCKELTKEHLPVKISSYDWLAGRQLTPAEKEEETTLAEAKLTHNWKRGNLPLTARCSICHEACGQDPGLCDWRCVWCARTVHDDCVAQVSEFCDLGPLSHYIIPPFLICLRQLGMRSYRKTVITKSPSAGRNLSSLTASSSSSSHDPSSRPQRLSWRPLIVIANRKSGGSDADAILSQFREVLNPVQVVDLATLSPLDGLRWCLLFPDVRFRILICGGDGTIGWVLRSADSMDFPTPPDFAVLPLGTGNDLSRVLGWGAGFTAAELSVREFLEDRLDKSIPAALDRWTVSVRSDRKFGIRRRKQIVMNNYFSVGCDALVTLNFHRKRERIPKAVSSRLLNKLLFFIYGTKDTFEKECRRLDAKIQLELDGRLMSLPELESVVVLNVNSWGAGVPVWSLGGADEKWPEEVSRFDDGILEVFGVYSSFHIAQLQVHLTEPYRIGRARRVRLVTRTPLPVQCDGEPWTQGPCVVDISFCNQVKMLRSPDPVVVAEPTRSSDDDETDDDDEDARFC